MSDPSEAIIDAGRDLAARLGRVANLLSSGSLWLGRLARVLLVLAVLGGAVS